MTIDEILTRVRELDAKATPGPWRATQSPHPPMRRVRAGECWLFTATADDAAFIALSRTALPILAAGHHVDDAAVRESRLARSER